MKKTLLFVCSLLISLSTNAADFESAKDAVKNMGIGWNLGNTLDANDATKTWKTTEEHETCWGQPVTTPELLKMMKEAGFGAIRVPVTWYQEMDANGKVNDAWMKRVKEVVDYVIDNGMYCLLNVHHDTGADGGTFKSWIKASSANYTANKDKYEGLWKQIAETFKDYDQHLLFEGYNEMLDEKNTWNEPVDKTDGYKAINDYAKSFVTVVRATGGNNAQRNLVVNTYSASNSSAAMKALELPEETGHIVFQIHNYPNWKDESTTRQLIDNLISDIKTNLISKGAPVIIGEYATFTTWPADLDYYEKDRKLALYAMDYFIKKTKEAGIGTFYWMGLSDGANRTLPAFNQPDLAECLAKAYHGSDFKGIYPTVDDFQIVYVVKWEKDWSELFLYGNWNTVTPLKLEDYKAVRVEVDEVPAAGSLQVKVYGDPDGKNADGSAKFKEGYYELSSDSKTTTVTFDQSKTGSVVSRLTLQTLGAKQAKLTKAVLIKSDDTEVELTPTVAWGCSVTTESTPKPTGIQSVKAFASENDDAIYNLSGQRITHPQRGFYIQNGKVHIVKVK
jgi:hypothetical protein